MGYHILHTLSVLLLSPLFLSLSLSHILLSHLLLRLLLRLPRPPHMPQPQTLVHSIAQGTTELKPIIETPRTLLPEPAPEIDIVKWVCDRPCNGHGGEVDVLCFVVVVFGVEEYLTCRGRGRGRRVNRLFVRCFVVVVFGIKEHLTCCKVLYSVVYSVRHGGLCVRAGYTSKLKWLNKKTRE